MPSNELLFGLNKYLEAAGIYNPYDKVYIKTKLLNGNIQLFLFLFVISQFPKLVYMKNITSFVSKKSSDQIDGFPFIIGLVTLFRQFNSDIINSFVEYLCQYTISLVNSFLSVNHELSMETQMVLEFLETFCRIAHVPKKNIQLYIPDVILNQYEYLSQKI